MSYKILSLKWRPSDFSEIIGQDHISKALSNAIKLDRVAQAFVFSGPRGVGKTTAARVLAKKLNNVNDLNDSIDIFEMDAASNRGIDEIRHLRENVQYAPSEGKYKIYIIDEAHMLTKEAFNALLKTLEEPPPHVIFIFATTELHKMPDTIISRTQRYDFKRLSTADIITRMIFILNDENISFDKESLDKIAEKADGSMRDALSILDQMICICDNNITIGQVSKSLGIIDDENFMSVLSLVGKRNTKDLLKLFNEIISSGVSMLNFIEGFNKFLNKCLLSNAMKEDEKYKEFHNLYKQNNIDLSELDLLRISEIFLAFQSSFRHLQQPRISIESLLVKLSYIDKTIDIQKFVISNSDLSNKDSEVKKKKNLNKVSEKVKDNMKVDNSPVVPADQVESIDEDLDIENKIIDRTDASNKGGNISDKSIYDNWNNVLLSINKANIVHSLEKIEIENISAKKLSIKILDINEFMYKNLLKDLKLINECINKYFNIDVQLEISYSENKKKKDKNNTTVDIKDQEHPLFMDAMNKFEGEMVR